MSILNRPGAIRPRVSSVLAWYTRPMRLLPLFVATAALLVAPVLVRAAVLRVESDGSGDFTAIQAAVDAAVSGDTVLVGPGTWTEHVAVEGKWFTLAGRDGAAATVLEGGYSGRPLTLIDSGRRCTVTGFTFTHGIKNGLFPDNSGGALAAFHVNLTVRDCVFRGNVTSAGGTGGAIHATARVVPGVSHTGPQPALSPEIEIADCLFEDNWASDEGAGIFIDDSETVITGSTFRRGEAVQGGAISQISRPLTVTDCRFEENRSRKDGGAVIHTANLSTPVTLRRCVFLDNRSIDMGEGGAVKMKGRESLVIQDCAFLRGGAWQGAGAHLQTASLLVDHTLWLDNRADDRGGALYLVSPAGAVLERCTWIANTASKATSIYADLGSFEVRTSILEDADPNAVLCHTASGTGSCLVGGPDTGGCIPFDEIRAVALCPSDSLSLCSAPSIPGCGPVGHLDAPCADAACNTPVRAVSWGMLKRRYR